MKNTYKIKGPQWRLWALAAVLVCFGTLTLFEPVIHAHELDPEHTEQDCAPCNWSQLQVNDQVHVPVPAPVVVFLEDLNPRQDFFVSTLHVFTSSRSPPSFR